MPSETVSAPGEDANSTIVPVGKAMKIWSSCRMKRHGVVVHSLQDTVHKARARLGIPQDVPVRCILEEDGTQVDDDEYFATLPTHTVLMILRADQQWLPNDRNSTLYNVQLADETDAGCSVSGTVSVTNALYRRCELLQRLMAEPGAIALLSASDLELLSQMPLSDHSAPLTSTADDDISETEQQVLLRRFERSFLEDVQEASCRYLDGRRDVEEALSYLKNFRRNVGGAVIDGDSCDRNEDN